MRNITFKQFLIASLLAIPTKVVSVGTEGCPTGSAGYMIGDPESLETYTSSLYQRLGGGAKLSVNGYSNDPSNGDGSLLAGYGNKQETYQKFSTKKVVIVKDNNNEFGIGVSTRTDAEAAAYLQAKDQGNKPEGRKLRKNKNKKNTKQNAEVDSAKQSEEGDSGIGPDDVLRFDFGGVQLKSLGVRITNLPYGETGTYRAYLDGIKVLESTFQGEDKRGEFVEFTIEGEILFDTLEFISNVKTNSGYLVSYMEYCKTEICTGKVGDVWGDPHVESYDGLDWNCQGAGHFLLLDGQQANSQYSNFQIQALFDKSPWSDEGQLTVTRAIAIDSGEKGVPVVQLTVPWDEKANKCKDFKFYVDGVETPIDAGTGKDDKVHVDIITGSEGKTYVLTYPDKGVQVSIDIWPTDDHGCLIDAGTCLGEYWTKPGNVAKGLLGGYPNDNTSDDWVDRAGNPVAIDMNDRKGKTAYEFCVKNWCIADEKESIFTYQGTTREGKVASFSEYNKCNDSKVVEALEKLEKTIEKAKQDPNNVCSKLPDSEVDDCLLESIACTSGDTCVNKFEKLQEERKKRKEKEGKYEPEEADKAVEYSAGSAKTAPPTEAVTAPPTPTKSVTDPLTAAINPTTTCGVDTDECTDDINSCCSDYKCVGNQYYKSCQLKQSATCLPRWAECTNNIDDCCEGNVCLGDKYYKQCLKITNAPTGSPSKHPTKNPTTAPTQLSMNPTNTATVHPTTSPTKSPTKSPTASPTNESSTPKTGSKYSASGAKGDPHIKTWDGEQYDYHGICDLVLLHNPEFYGGLGMDIHIRTKKTRQWSYISTAVLRIGDDTFEVMAQRKQNHYWLNGVAGKELTQEMTLPVTISSFPIHYRRVNSQQLEYVVDLGTEEKIVMKTWKNFVRVDVVDPRSENFASSVGLMGTFGKSLKVGRDNSTIFQDLNEFGQEWQVLPTEPKLFHNIDGPQAPKRCEIPSSTQIRRNLAESEVSREAAELACAEVTNKDEFDLCVFDVIATSDQNIAGAY